MIDIKPLSENAVVAYFGEKICQGTHERIRMFNNAIQLRPFAGFVESVPAFVSLTVYYDPVQVLADELLEGKQAYERVARYLRQLPVERGEGASTKLTPIDIPVCYSAGHGPDLDEVAGHHGLQVDEVIALHSSALYTVYMIGFMPGFPYLGGMPEKIATPRKASPRKQVAAGSVGIAGHQTGIYPAHSPGGWQIIGRTPLKLFDREKPPFTLLKAGDRVRFYPISEAEFEQLT